MLRKTTAVILGAGASIPYGFPSGAELLRMARGFDLRNLQSKLRDVQLEGDTEKLLAALKRTHDPSLDTLLELRPDITTVGKRLIAALLLEFEFNSSFRFPEPKDDWLTLFFSELAANTKSLQDFVQNPLNFITFNYDRLLEHRLVGALSAHYGRPDSECIAALSKIPIVHVHGYLGPMPGFDGTSPTVPFGPPPSNASRFGELVPLAAEKIIIVHEAQANNPEYERARRLLQAVDQVVMLGFGYDATNLSRLELHRWKPNIPVWGTAYGLSESRIVHDVRSPFESAKIRVQRGDPSHGAREFLDNHLQIFRG
jgi:hypothetical protein